LSDIVTTSVMQPVTFFARSVSAFWFLEFLEGQMSVYIAMVHFSATLSICI